MNENKPKYKINDDKMSIKKIITDMGNNNKILLPAIQRKFVWSEEKILQFMDSIILGYPLGMLLFWKLSGKEINELKSFFTFYEFLKNYNYFDNKNNEPIRNFYEDEYRAVLDGQQRLTALRIALDGYIEVKKKKNDKNNYETIKKNLCINILNIRKPKPEKNYKLDREKEELDYEEDDDENLNKYDNESKTMYYNLDFKNENDKQDLRKEYWIELGELITSEEDVIIKKFEKNSDYKQNLEIIKNNINFIQNKFCKEGYIIYYDIECMDIEELLELFVRVNSGGQVLQKTDLLFSTIISKWNDGRKNVDELINNLNKEGGSGIKTFDFNTDYIMKTCLYLLDFPSLDIDLKIFKDERIIRLIKEEWPYIEQAMKDTVDLLRERGFNYSNITSYNAIMPIIYYIYKKGKCGEKEKKEIFKYFFIAQINRTFGGTSNSTLIDIRNTLTKEDNHELKDRNFKFNQFRDFESGQKNLKVDKELIDSWFKYKKGKYVYLILSVILENNNDYKTFHMDHMHPDAILKTNGSFAPYKDKLCNIQLLIGPKNTRKSKQELYAWINDDPDNNKPQICPMKDGEPIYTNSKEFFDFYLARRNLLKEKLFNLFGFEFTDDDKMKDKNEIEKDKDD